MGQQKTPVLSGQILEEATTWFVEFNEGELCLADREAFIEWLKTSPEHIRAYLQVAAHWEEAQTLSKTLASPINELVALAREPSNATVISIGGTRSSDACDEPESATALSLPTSNMRAPTQLMHRHRFVIAASITTLMIGVGALWMGIQRGVYTTDIGEQRSILLRDGSTVELNAHSKIRVALHEHERDVELIEGEALFRVAKDHARPFIVHSGETNVLAVGTQFDVYKRQSGTRVTVVEGRVAVFPSTLPIPTRALDLTSPAPPVPAPKAVSRSKAPESAGSLARINGDTPGQGSAQIGGLPVTEYVAASKEEIFLGAGEQLTVSSASTEKAAHADVAAATAWIQKQIVFNSTPLSEVVEEFNRYNTRQLVIVDSRISDTKISGEFSSTNPDSLLKGLDALEAFKISATADRIEISSK